MPKRKEPELDPKEQFKRFQEAAKKAGVDESGTLIETTFTTLARRGAVVQHERQVQKRSPKDK